MILGRIGRASIGPVLALGLAASCVPLDDANLDVPYEPTPPAVVTEMLSIAGTGPQDVVYDLGSGDGRIVVAAVKEFGARRAIGIDIDPERIREARANAAGAGVAGRASFVEGNLFAFDFGEATVLTMYLLPEVNISLRSRILTALRPGTRVVSHRFDMDDWEPDRATKVGNREVYFWIVPANVAGRWAWDVDGRTYRLEIEQKYQKIAGRLHVDGQPARIEGAWIEGDRLNFTAPLGEGALRFSGRVAGNGIDATVETGVIRRVIARRDR